MSAEVIANSASAASEKEHTPSLLKKLGYFALLVGGSAAVAVGVGTIFQSFDVPRPEVMGAQVLPSVFEMFNVNPIPDWLKAVSFLGSIALISAGASAIQWTVNDWSGDNARAAAADRATQANPTPTE